MNAYFALLEVGMGSEARLAVLARSVQWELDEAAFELGGGRYTYQQRRRLAEQLRVLAGELTSDDDRAVVSDTAAG